MHGQSPSNWLQPTSVLRILTHCLTGVLCDSETVVLCMHPTGSMQAMPCETVCARLHFHEGSCIHKLLKLSGVVG